MCYKYLLGWLLLLWMGSFSATAQEDNVSHELEKNSSILDRFSQRCERRTDKALRRMQRYEDKLKEKTIENAEKKAKTKGGIRKRNLIPFDEYGENPQKRKMDSIQMAQREEFAIREDSIRAHQPKDVNRDGINIRGIESSSPQGLGKEPLLDSLQLASGFMQYASPSLPTTGNTVNQSIDRAKSQLDMTGRVKSELYRQRDYWKSQLKEHPEYRKYVEKLDKECYYYSAQINKYRSALRDPSVLDDHLMNVLRRDPRFSDFLATLPAKPQDPAKMQPRQLVQQMMHSQAAAIDEDPTALIRGAKEKDRNCWATLAISLPG